MVDWWQNRSKNGEANRPLTKCRDAAKVLNLYSCPLPLSAYAAMGNAFTQCNIHSSVFKHQDRKQYIFLGMVFVIIHYRKLPDIKVMCWKTWLKRGHKKGWGHKPWWQRMANNLMRGNMAKIWNVYIVRIWSYIFSKSYWKK